jgi:hypothetical protein
MINKVSNMEELRAEKARLVLKRKSLEDAIKNDVKEIKENLNPFHFLKSKATENGIVDNLLGTSLAFCMDFLFTRMLFRKSSFIKKTVLSLLIQMAGSKIIAGKSEVILSVIKKFINKLRAEDKNENFDRTTASDEY